MIVLMFKDRFGELIRSGQKTSTIRALKRPIKPGEILSLREWSGKPYRSKMRRLITDTPAKTVEPFCIAQCGGGNSVFYPWVLGAKFDLPLEARNKIAIADGFKDEAVMFAWLARNYGFPFFGTLITW